MDHTGERPFPCPYESCSERFKTQWKVNLHIKTAKKHAGHRLASKFLDKYLLPFICQVDIVLSSSFLIRYCNGLTVINQLKTFVMFFEMILYLQCNLVQAEGCVNRYETELERDRHMEKLHPRD